MIQTALLADHLDVIPTLAEWFRDQWPDYFAGRILPDIEADFHKEAQRHYIPVRLVAFVDGELVGTVVLRDRAIAILPKTHPGLGGLFVRPQYRKRGIATELVQAGMNVAREQGYGEVYATTVVAGGILTRLGWIIVEEVVEHGDEQLTLYRCDLEACLAR